MGWIVFIVTMVIGANIGFGGNMMLGGLIQLAGIIYLTRGFWMGLFGIGMSPKK